MKTRTQIVRMKDGERELDGASETESEIAERVKWFATLEASFTILNMV